MIPRTLAFLGLAALLVGCARTETFQVTVINHTPSALSVGLIKTGPLEKGWDAPVDIAKADPKLMEKHWSQAVAPQSTATLGPQTGTIDSHTTALLRVYVGDLPIEELLAISRTGGRRMDIPIQPGKSAFIIDMKDGSLCAQSVPPKP